MKTRYAGRTRIEVLPLRWTVGCCAKRCNWDMSREHTVKVWDKPHVVAVSRKSKTVWIAVGEYMGATVEVKGTSENAALKRWREAATYRGS